MDSGPEAPIDSVVHTYVNEARENARLFPSPNAKIERGDGRVRFNNVSILNERLETVETVVSKQDISSSFEYDLRDAEEVNHVVV